jgi:selenocysteine lyase/cysteine desulfurase
MLSGVWPDFVALGRRRGIPVIVDGAHSFAQFDYKISDLDCDYFATSLHKWLYAPHGTGLLYVRRAKIRELWPLTPARAEQADDIRKLEEVGTHPEANALAIAEALTFIRTWAVRARMHGCATCATPGPSGCSPRAACGCTRALRRGRRGSAPSAWRSSMSTASIR